MSSEKVITTINEQVKLDAWQREMEEQQSSGLSVKRWCKERGLSQSAYYHRLRKLREAVGEQECKDRSVLSCPVPTPVPATAIVPIRQADTPLVGSPSGLSGGYAGSSSSSSSVGSSSGVEIERGRLRIKVSGECPAELVCAMLRELKA